MTQANNPPGQGSNTNEQPTNEQPTNEQPEALQGGKEPDGGPAARGRAFLEERFATLGPKSPRGETVDSESRGSTAPAAAAETPKAALDRLDDSNPLPPDFRRNLVAQYRQRQRQKLGTEIVPPQPAAGDTQPERGDSGEETLDEEPQVPPPPPTPPAPPPANNWIPIGPSVLRQGQGGVKPATSGRTPGIAVAPGGDRVYIATANGGVWYSPDTGRSWRSLMEAFDLDPTHKASDTLSCGAIALVAGTTASLDRIYVGSGEAHSGVGAMFGVGPVVSFNGGTDWNTETVSSSSSELAGSGFYSLAVDPADPERVVAGTRQGVYRREPDGSGGIHWDQKTMGGVADQQVTSVVVARRGSTTTFYAVRQNGPIYSSNDGDNWSQVGTGFPTGDNNVGRITLAIQPTNPDIIYAFTSRGSVYRFDSSDENWRLITGIPANIPGDQGWYDLAIALSPDNVNKIYLGGSTSCADSSGNLITLNEDEKCPELAWSGALYRCDIIVKKSNDTITGVTSSNTFIGGSVHADIHTIVFAPADANKLWVGCDGGVFYSTKPTGNGNIFQAMNAGLATLTMNHLGQHPTEDAVVFCGSQDNGAGRFTGEEAWLHSFPGDGGYCVVNWNDPYQVLSTYVNGGIRRSKDGGARYSFSDVNVPLQKDDPNTTNINEAEQVLFYAPLVGTPRNPRRLSEANIVAFGSIRPWISTTFGGSWKSIPNNSLAGDSLNATIRSLAFASATILHAGTMRGGVYRFNQSGGTWTRTQVDTLGGANSLPLNGPVTDIAVDPADATGNSIYITFGGIGDYRHVWHFDGTQWQQRSGPAAGNLNSLLDVQTNAIVVDPANTNHIYVGVDIGIWRSTDGGINWETYSEGLPDAAVIDLKLHNPRRLLRASTHGRGVFERTIDSQTAPGVELYIRDTQLDQGRFKTVDGLDDPTQLGKKVDAQYSPDIKFDIQDGTGKSQFPSGDIDFLEFVDTLIDDSQNQEIQVYNPSRNNHIYVQVHNRGVKPANNVKVILLITNISEEKALELPDQYWLNIQKGKPINTDKWKTVGITILNDIRVGFPRIATFSLTPTHQFSGTRKHMVLALVHHKDDPYISTERNVDKNSLKDRKTAQKRFGFVVYLSRSNLPSLLYKVLPIIVLPWLIIVGGLLLTPEGFLCIKCGRLDPRYIGDTVINILGIGLIFFGLGGTVSSIVQRNKGHLEKLKGHSK